MPRKRCLTEQKSHDCENYNTEMGVILIDEHIAKTAGKKFNMEEI